MRREDRVKAAGDRAHARNKGALLVLLEVAEARSYRSEDRMRDGDSGDGRQRGTHVVTRSQGGRA